MSKAHVEKSGGFTKNVETFLDENEIAVDLHKMTCVSRKLFFYDANFLSEPLEKTHALPVSILTRGLFIILAIKGEVMARSSAL